MNKTEKLKIFNDPIYGFITIPTELVFKLIEHRFFQRLRRIHQMGLSYLVFAGAHHSRFHHALGSMHLMQKAIAVLKLKKVSLSKTEKEALLAAALLHDLGHGPFSHALEGHIVKGLDHEAIGLQLLQELNKEFEGALDLTLKILKKKCPRPFMWQLVSGQVDIDRADYLRRDSFFTGVPEGNINSERLMTVLNVVDDKLVIEEKGIYTVEKFLLARRHMYWQVYLHKTSLVAEHMLLRILRRAQELIKQGVSINASEPLLYFLKQQGGSEFTDHDLRNFTLLDDYDILAALKSWQFTDDRVLATLSKGIINRRLLKIKFKRRAPGQTEIKDRKQHLVKTRGFTEAEADYFVFGGAVENQAYNLYEQHINILTSKGKVIDVHASADTLTLEALSNRVTKYFICFPKNAI